MSKKTAVTSESVPRNAAKLVPLTVEIVQLLSLREQHVVLESRTNGDRTAEGQYSTPQDRHGVPRLDTARFTMSHKVLKK